MNEYNAISETKTANKIIQHFIEGNVNCDYPVFPDSRDNILRILKAYKRIYKLNCDITKIGKCTISIKSNVTYTLGGVEFKFADKVVVDPYIDNMINNRKQHLFKKGGNKAKLVLTPLDESIRYPN